MEIYRKDSNLTVIHNLINQKKELKGSLISFLSLSCAEYTYVLPQIELTVL